MDPQQKTSSQEWGYIQKVENPFEFFHGVYSQFPSFASILHHGRLTFLIQGDENKNHSAFYINNILTSPTVVLLSFDGPIENNLILNIFYFKNVTGHHA